MKVVVIGCGYWGKNLVRNFFELGALDGICDQDSQVVKKLSDDYQVEAVDINEVWQRDVDGIVISTPAVQHYELAKKALLSGKHVFVEKPLSLNVSEAQELCCLADQNEKILMVGHLLQYHPAFLELKRLVNEKQLGDLQYIYSNRLNLGKFRSEENILWSFAPHDISMILGLVGSMPESVYATGSCHLNHGIQDVTTTHLQFHNGVQSHIFVSWLHPYKEQKLVVVGEKGMAVFDDGRDWGEKLQYYPHQVHWVDGLPQPSKAEGMNLPVNASEPLKIECQHFLDCIENNTQARTNGQEGLRVLKVLDAAQKSLYKELPVSVLNHAELEQDYFCHDSAMIDEECQIGEGTKIWHFSHILRNTIVGKGCTIGQNVMIGPEVVVGDYCKIQNNVSLYKGVILGEGVFCGPSCVFTNVTNPRAEVERKDEFLPTRVEKGVTIGANATILCGIRLGAYSFIGAGAVVTKDVKSHALVIGNPARQTGWVSHAGEKLDENFMCPREGRKYQLTQDNQLEEIVDGKSREKEKVSL